MGRRPLRRSLLWTRFGDAEFSSSWRGRRFFLSAELFVSIHLHAGVIAACAINQPTHAIETIVHWIQGRELGRPWEIDGVPTMRYFEGHRWMLDVERREARNRLGTLKSFEPPA